MAKKFSDLEKETIQKKLMDLCEASWGEFGYRKTTIDRLCHLAGISKGAFYLFFESKELLFFHTAYRLQTRFNTYFIEVIENNPTKEGFVSALKQVYRQLDAGNWIVNYNDPEYQVFVSKLPEDKQKIITDSNLVNFQQVLHLAGLTPKIPEEKIPYILSTLLYTQMSKGYFGNRHIEIFDFLLEQAIEGLFE